MTRLRNMLKMGACAILLSAMLVGCYPSRKDLEAVVYAPLAGADWPVSTPEAQGLDPLLVATTTTAAAISI
jgi:hypothetical protein